MIGPFLLPLLSAFSVFPLWFLEKLLPFPYLLEEILKFSLVFFILKEEKRKVLYALLGGILFALSETFFYFATMSSILDPKNIAQRLVLTTTLHCLTFCLMAYFYSKNKNLIFLGLFVSILIHYFYNLAAGAFILK
jgi:hypothetical protein